MKWAIFPFLFCGFVAIAQLLGTPRALQPMVVPTPTAFGLVPYDCKCPGTWLMPGGSAGTLREQLVPQGNGSEDIGVHAKVNVTIQLAASAAVATRRRSRRPRERVPMRAIRAHS